MANAFMGFFQETIETLVGAIVPPHSPSQAQRVAPVQRTPQNDVNPSIGNQTDTSSQSSYINDPKYVHPSKKTQVLVFGSMLNFYVTL